MSKAGTSIFDLEARFKKRRKRPTKALSVHYDSGLPIDIRYNSGFYAPSGAATAASFALPAAAALQGGRYQVEDFEEEEENEAVYGTGELGEEEDEENSSNRQFVASARSLSEDDELSAPVWGTGELEAMSDAETAASLSEEDGMELPVWGTGELEALNAGSESESQAASFSEQSVEDTPVWGTGELGELKADPPAATAQSYTSPNAAALAHKLNEERLLNSDDPDTRAFAQDLEAILAGQKEHPSTTPRHTIREEDEEEENAPPPSDDNAYSSSFSHRVFDQMGSDMSLAKTFNLGSYDLSNQFDVFDRQMDLEERTAERKKHKHLRQKQQTRDAAYEFAEDMAYISHSPAPVRARAMDAPLTYDLTFDVPLIPQQTGMSCWAAGAAMLVAWRDQLSIDPSEIANATGAWTAYVHGLQPNDASIFPVWGMAPEAPQSYTVEGFYNLLNTYGPLWVAGAVPSPHIRVVAGMRGDGTPDGTTLMINDPWETGMTTFHLPNAGVQYTRTYTQFVREMETLALRETDIPGAVYVAHLRGPRRR